MGMTISRTILSVIALGVLLVAACGDDTSTSDSVAGDDDATTPDVTLPQPDDGDPNTIDGSWILTSGHLDSEPFDLVDGWNVTLTIDGDQVSGTAACNGYGGTLTTDDRLGGGGPFRVTALSWTEMGCEPDVMQLEQRYLAALQAVDSYELAGSLHLGVTDVGTSLAFDPVAPVAGAEIVGTTWVLDTMIQGDAASNSPIMSDATLTLDEDGTLTGSTGCRLLEGEWVIAGAEIVFTRFSAIDNPVAGVCAPGPEALDGFVISVLEGGFSVEVDGRHMTLMSQGNEGLSYTAG
jgi:heat shock protein HslJ